MRYADHQGDIDAILAPSLAVNMAERRAIAIASGLLDTMAHTAISLKMPTSVQRMSTILGSLGQCPKYSAINLEHWSTKNTIEFRQHQGSLSLDKINHWIGLLVTMLSTVTRRA